MPSLRPEKRYPGAFRRVVIREDNLLQRGLSETYDWMEVRQLKGNDFFAVEQMRLRDRQWLAPWEAASPPGYGQPITLESYVSAAARSARAGKGMYLAILPEGRLAGQVSISQVNRGACMSAALGYWINSRFAGQGLTPIAVAMVIDWCLQHYGLHRIEINIRPENAPSLRLVEKLGLRYEGLRQGFIYIDGAWADHHSFAITAEEWRAGILLERLSGN